MSKQYLRAASVAARYDTTPTTIRRWARHPNFSHLNFPQSISISDGVEAWDSAELDGWDETRKAFRAARDGKAA